MQPETVQQDEKMFATIQEIAEMLLPERISFSDISKHLRGYDKGKAVDDVVGHAREEPLLTRLRLMMVYSKLHELYKNGGLP